MITIVLLLLVSGLMAQGVPLAINAYKKVTLAADAHTLISTTMTELREKLALSDSISCTETAVSFVSPNGRAYELNNKGQEGIYLEYKSGVGEDDSHLLVSDKAQTEELFTKYDAVSISGNELVFGNLAVYRKTENGPTEFVKVDKYVVKLIRNGK